MRVKLQDIVDALSMQFEEQQQFLNLETSEITLVQDIHFRIAEDIEDVDHFDYPIEWEKEEILKAYDVLVSDDNYLALPDRYEVNEYNIMEEFCLQLLPPKSEVFLNAIRGRGAFRRFRDLLERYGILEQWYNFEQQSLTEIAREWCRKNEVPYE
ncbi:MAG: UPF0158 family protein [Eubacteriales bacterium]|nr:UPF0158 family protein [Eubacteriales bacterium]